MLAEKKARIRTEMATDIKKDDFTGHDLMTNLLRLNMSSDVQADQRMTDEEVLAQIPLFLFAGNTTVAVTLTWAVAMLAQHPDVQERLRAEAQRIDTDSPDWDTVNSLPYLEAFTHELCRLYPAAPTLFRVPQHPVTLPLAHSVTGRNGKPIETLQLNKGDTVHIAYGNMNWSTAIFGPDAMQFNPDRFLDQGQKATWDHTMTFGGGARNCIGSRFALAEIKVTLFVLLQGLSFEESSSKPQLTRFGGLGLARPKANGKVAMPLVVKSLPL